MWPVSVGWPGTLHMLRPSERISKSSLSDSEVCGMYLADLDLCTDFGV